MCMWCKYCLIGSGGYGVGLLHLLTLRISLKRDSAVSKEVLSELNQTNGKKLTKAEKDER